MSDPLAAPIEPPSAPAPGPTPRLRTVAAGAFAFVLSAIFVWFAAFDGTYLEGGLTGSDATILTQIHWNMLHRTAGWFTEQQPRLLGVVPDQLVHHALAQVLGDFRLTLPSLVTLTLFADIVLAAALVARFAQTGAVPALAAVTFVVLGAFVVTLGWPLHAQIVAPINHSGGLVLSLAVALTIGRPPRDPLLLVLVAAGCFSDMLFVVMAVVPWIAADLVLHPPAAWRPGALRRYWPPALATVVGFLAQTPIFRQGPPAPWPSVILESLRSFLRDVPSDGRLSIALVLGVVASAMAVRTLWRRAEADPSERALMAYAAVAMAGSLAAMIFFYVDYWSLRYAWPMVAWPLILAAGASAKRIGAGAIAAAGVLAGGLAVAAVVRQGGRPPILDRQDPERLCVSTVVTEEKLNAGLAEYWHARRLVVSSDFTLKIEQVDPKDGSAHLWGNDPYWFLHDHRRADGGVRYDFVLMTGLDRAGVKATYGEPDAVRTCPGTEVWIWRDPDRLLPILVAKSQKVLDRIRHPERR